MDKARVLALMMVLFRQFTVTAVVNDPDNKTGLVTYWTNADAERRYEELKRSYGGPPGQKEG